MKEAPWRTDVRLILTDMMMRDGAQDMYDPWFLFAHKTLVSMRKQAGKWGPLAKGWEYCACTFFTAFTTMQQLDGSDGQGDGQGGEFTESAALRSAPAPPLSAAAEKMINKLASRDWVRGGAGVGENAVNE